MPWYFFPMMIWVAAGRRVRRAAEVLVQALCAVLLSAVVLGRSVLDVDPLHRDRKRFFAEMGEDNVDWIKELVG